MRTVYGLGETICDIIFKDNQPVTSKAGGSTFNAMVSLGRMGVHNSFISKIGDDRIGRNIIEFMRKNNVSTENVTIRKGDRTDLALAFLNDRGDAEYSFYKDSSSHIVDAVIPNFKKDDILLLGSYFSINLVLRSFVKSVLDAAKKADAIIYYDPNFRSSHNNEIETLWSALSENLSMATIVRGSDEDFENIFGEKSDYLTDLTNLAPRLILTRSSDGVDVLDNGFDYHYAARNIIPVSTVGAGDNFNAGLIYALVKYEIGFDDIKRLKNDDWSRLVNVAIDFSSEVCQSYDNYISLEFANSFSL